MARGWLTLIHLTHSLGALGPLKAPCNGPNGIDPMGAVRLTVHWSLIQEGTPIGYPLSITPHRNLERPLGETLNVLLGAGTGARRPCSCCKGLLSPDLAYTTRLAHVT